MIQENLNRTREKVIAAARRAGRNPDEITLLAVSKTKPAELLREAYQAGQRCFGENKVQEILEKAVLLEKDIEWHMIGHLQTNKVRQIIDKVTLIHSVDSLHLAQAIQKEAERRAKTVHILMEINIADEASKYGIQPENAIAFAHQLSGLANLRLDGLMTVAPYTENPESNRKYFQQMKQLAVDISNENIDNVSMSVLSMGMSGDYEVAIEEGATCVRVGTGIFGERNYNI